MIRRRIPRIPAPLAVPVRLSHGDRRCRAELVDYSPLNCAVRITDPAFEHWTAGDLMKPLLAVIHDEPRTAILVRLHRVRTDVSQYWLLGLLLR